MKHPARVVLIIVAVWLLAQLIGLFVVEHYATAALPAGVERPDLPAQQVPVYLFICVALGTGLVLLLARFKQRRLWSVWFGIAIFMLSYIAVSAFLPLLLALAVSGLFVYLKLDRRLHWILRNLPELFVYAGIAAIFAPMLTVPIALLVLAIISVYDAIAVWQSKHMVSLARFQIDSGRFAGFSVPRELGPASSPAARAEPKAPAKVGTASKTPKKPSKGGGSAILGGGDFAFPLVFSGALLMRIGWIPALGATVGGYLALLVLFSLSKEGRFYPAMPFLSTGLIVGAAVAVLL